MFIWLILVISFSREIYLASTGTKDYYPSEAWDGGSARVTREHTNAT